MTNYENNFGESLKKQRDYQQRKDSFEIIEEMCKNKLGSAVKSAKKETHYFKVISQLGKHVEEPRGPMC